MGQTLLNFIECQCLKYCFTRQDPFRIVLKLKTDIKIFEESLGLWLEKSAAFPEKGF
jgi:hypothetical protein